MFLACYEMRIRMSSDIDSTKECEGLFLGGGRGKGILMYLWSSLSCLADFKSSVYLHRHFGQVTLTQADNQSRNVVSHSFCPIFKTFRTEAFACADFDLKSCFLSLPHWDFSLSTGLHNVSDQPRTNTSTDVSCCNLKCWPPEWNLSFNLGTPGPVNPQANACRSGCCCD